MKLYGFMYLHVKWAKARGVRNCSRLSLQKLVSSRAQEATNIYIESFLLKSQLWILNLWEDNFHDLRTGREISWYQVQRYKEIPINAVLCNWNIGWENKHWAWLSCPNIKRACDVKQHSTWTLTPEAKTWMKHCTDIWSMIYDTLIEYNEKPRQDQLRLDKNFW